MTKYLILILLFPISTLVYGQTWIDKGAEWHFNYNGFMDAGFIKVKYNSDTIIEGKQCQKLEPYRYKFTANQYQQWFYLGVYPEQPEFTYLSGDTVFWFKNNQFHVLYNFGAQPGDTWDLGIDTNMWLCSSSIVEVDTITTIILNENSYRCVHVRPNVNSSYYLWGWIIERFGSSNGYLFPMENNCDSMIAVEFDEINFSCYKDTSFQLLNITNKDCEYFFDLVNVPELIINEISINPNPVIDYFNIDVQNNYQIENVSVFDMQGGLKCTYYTSKISLKEYKSGLYLIKIVLTNGKIIYKKIIKN